LILEECTTCGEEYPPRLTNWVCPTCGIDYGIKVYDLKWEDDDNN
jgi:predicted RNA-binding Zn-ribbon protein involved in translation (DUF1610 family)